MVITRIIDFPDCKAQGMVIRDSDGNDNIYINSRLSFDEQFKALIHELNHVNRNDFDKADVVEIERSANG